MLFTTEVLPLLQSRPGVRVEVTGEPADYREAGDSLQIGVSRRRRRRSTPTGSTSA